MTTGAAGCCLRCCNTSKPVPWARRISKSTTSGRVCEIRAMASLAVDAEPTIWMPPKREIIRVKRSRKKLESSTENKFVRESGKDYRPGRTRAMLRVGKMTTRPKKNLWANQTGGAARVGTTVTRSKDKFVFN